MVLFCGSSLPGSALKAATNWLGSALTATEAAFEVSEAAEDAEAAEEAVVPDADGAAEDVSPLPPAQAVSSSAADSRRAISLPCVS